jgi:Rrf2 family protein
VNTHPVVVRRIMGALRNAGLVTVQPGVGGGAALAREPEAITLLDVYRAVEEREDLFSLPPSQPSSSCNVGGNIRDVLQPVFCRAHQAVGAVLEQVSIAEVARAVLERARAGGCCGGDEAVHALYAHEATAQADGG